MRTFLLDTNICVEMTRRPLGPVADVFRRRPVESMAISSITLAELRYGVAKSTNPEQAAVALAITLAPIQVMHFDDDAATAYGTLRATLEGLGSPIGPLDTLIAAHAVALKAVLVTSNEREFKRVPSLRVENWLRPG